MKLLLIALSLTMTTVWSNAATTMLANRDRLMTEFCAKKELPQKTPCEVIHDAIVVNQLIADESLWAFSYVIKGISVSSQRETIAAQNSIARLNGRPLEINRDRVAVIFYYREKATKLSPVITEEFHRLALNPTHKIVARFHSEFLLSGSTLRYKAPPAWETEGLAPSTTSTLAFAGHTNIDRPMRFEILNLDDQPIPSLKIAACRISSAKAPLTPCDALKASAPPKANFSLELDIKAERKLKSDQPAFKVVMRYADETGREQGNMAMQLAIPFKPQPNYFLFGVTGFLFGGLIAVMMLFMRRKQKTTPK